MDIHTALRKARNQKLIGWSLVIVFGILALMSFLKSIYFTTASDDSIFSFVSKLLNNLVVIVYQKTQFLSFLWEIAPIPDMKSFSDPGSIATITICSVFLLGTIIRDSGKNLSNRIRDAKKQAESNSWARSIDSESSSETVVQHQIELGRKDQWYKRPSGLILIAVISGLIINIISKFMGLG